MPKESVLKDHKRIGKRFIPPFLQLGGLREVSYINMVLPEILWMGLIIDNLDYRAGVSFCEKTATLAFDAHASEKHLNFALCSSYTMLDTDAKNKYLTLLKKEKLLELLQEYLAPLIILYHDFPMSFLGLTCKRLDKGVLITRLKEAITRYMNKYEQPGLVLQALTMYIRGMTGALYYSKEIEPPDLNALIEDPESEAAQRAGAHVRTHVLGEVSLPDDEATSNWSTTFWDQRLDIDTCEFRDLEHE